MSQRKTWMVKLFIPSSSLKKINDYMWPDTPVPTGFAPGYPLLAFSCRFENGISAMLMLCKGETSCYLLAPVFNESGVALDPEAINVQDVEVLHAGDELTFVYKDEDYVIQIEEY